MEYLKPIVFGGVLIVIFVVAFLGGLFGYQQYQSLTYNDLLKKADSNWIQAKGNLSQINLTSNSYDTNIKYAQNAINLTDQAINQTQQMTNIAPDNATSAYAQIRLAEYQNAKKLEEYILKINEDLKTSGIFATAALIQNSAQDINNTSLNIAAEQNQLIQLVNANPSLYQRIVNVLGQNRVNQILTPAPAQGNGTGALN